MSEIHYFILRKRANRQWSNLDQNLHSRALAGDGRLAGANIYLEMLKDCSQTSGAVKTGASSFPGAAAMAIPAKVSVAQHEAKYERTRVLTRDSDRLDAHRDHELSLDKPRNALSQHTRPQSRKPTETTFSASTGFQPNHEPVRSAPASQPLRAADTLELERINVPANELPTSVLLRRRGREWHGQHF